MSLEDPADALRLKARIVRLDAQNEAVHRGSLELLGRKDRMVKTRQAAEGQQPKKASCYGEQHHQLEGPDRKGRPAIVRPSADIDRVIESFIPVLDEIAPAGAEHGTKKNHQRQPHGAAWTQHLIKPFDRVRSIGFDLA